MSLIGNQVVSPLSETKHRKYFNDTEHKPDTERLESSDIVAEEPSVDVNLRGRKSIFEFFILIFCFFVFAVEIKKEVSIIEA